MQNFLVLILTKCEVNFDKSILYYLQLNNENLLKANLSSTIILDDILNKKLSEWSSCCIREAIREKMKEKKSLKTEVISKMMLDHYELKK